MEAGLPEGSRRRSARASAVLFALPLAACSASSPAGAGDLGPAADQAAAGVARAIHLVLALTADAD
ncbi:hypothetical protein ACQUE4_13410, partial [Lactococcus lactis]|uniref:hypothetical protein n=1 Tax=Lactococcus lactis TaxID=1358 RepID=UPI003D113E05